MIQTTYPGANRDEVGDTDHHKIETQKNKVPKSLYEINSYLFPIHLCLLQNDLQFIISIEVPKKIRYKNIYKKLTLFYFMFTYVFCWMIFEMLLVMVEWQYRPNCRVRIAMKKEMGINTKLSHRKIMYPNLNTRLTLIISCSTMSFVEWFNMYYLWWLIDAAYRISGCESPRGSRLESTQNRDTEE